MKFLLHLIELYICMWITCWPKFDLFLYVKCKKGKFWLVSDLIHIHIHIVNGTWKGSGQQLVTNKLPIISHTFVLNNSSIVPKVKLLDALNHAFNCKFFQIFYCFITNFVKIIALFWRSETLLLFSTIRLLENMRIQSWNIVHYFWYEFVL